MHVRQNKVKPHNLLVNHEQRRREGEQFIVAVLFYDVSHYFVHSVCSNVGSYNYVQFNILSLSLFLVNLKLLSQLFSLPLNINFTDFVLPEPTSMSQANDEETEPDFDIN